MCRGGERNFIPTAFGKDISSKFNETAWFCDAVGSPNIFLGGWFGSSSAKVTIRSPYGDSM